MKQQNVVITSGYTSEYIDGVRVLANISSGHLGSILADIFLENGQKVTYVSHANSIEPHLRPTQNIAIKGVNDLMGVMEDVVPKADIVIQCMAVSDFTFDLKEVTKISSTSPESFIDHMRKTIRTTPKVISYFKGWNPNAVLVGFKFTVGKNKTEISEIAHKLMSDNQLDMVFSNDKVQMKKKGSHNGVLFMKDWDEPLYGKRVIATSIYQNSMRLCQFK